MRLSLVVPATNSPPTLQRCLEAIAAACEGPDEVIVVEEPESLGPAAARNAGAEQATGEIVAFVDADVLVHDDAFEHMRAAFGREPELVALFGGYDDTVATSGIVAGFRNLLHHTVHQRSAGSVASFWAGLGAVRHDAFAASGGFDARRYPRPSIEDVELGGRLAGLGPILLDPALLGTHLKEWTLRSMIRTDFSSRGVPWVRLMLEQRSVPATLNVGARERASALAALLVAAGLLRRAPTLAIAGITAQVALNTDLYAKLVRRLGLAGAVAGAGLHTVHQLTAAAAVPAGSAAHAAGATSRRRSRSRRPTRAGR